MPDFYLTWVAEDDLDMRLRVVANWLLLVFCVGSLLVLAALQTRYPVCRVMMTAVLQSMVAGSVLYLGARWMVKPGAALLAGAFPPVLVNTWMLASLLRSVL